MKLLFELDQRHPGIIAIVGSISGAFSWFIGHSSQIGATATAAIAVLSLARLLFRGVADIYLWLRKRRRNHEQRRAWKRHQPGDDHLDFTHHD